MKYDCPGECSLINQTIIPRARMDSESIAHEVEAEWAIDSDAMRARGIIFFSKIQLVGQKYRDKTTLAS